MSEADTLLAHTWRPKPSAYAQAMDKCIREETAKDSELRELKLTLIRLVNDAKTSIARLTRPVEVTTVLGVHGREMAMLQDELGRERERLEVLEFHMAVLGHERRAVTEQNLVGDLGRGKIQRGEIPEFRAWLFGAELARICMISELDAALVIMPQDDSDRGLLAVSRYCASQSLAVGLRMIAALDAHCQRNAVTQ